MENIAKVTLHGDFITQEAALGTLQYLSEDPEASMRCSAYRDSEGHTNRFQSVTCAFNKHKDNKVCVVPPTAFNRTHSGARISCICRVDEVVRGQPVNVGEFFFKHFLPSVRQTRWSWVSLHRSHCCACLVTGFLGGSKVGCLAFNAPVPTVCAPVWSCCCRWF